MKITLAHIHDTHGRHLPMQVTPGNSTAQTGDPGRETQSFERAGRVGGHAALASAVNAVRGREGASNVLLMRGGDTFSDDLLGNLTKGAATIELMNAISFPFLALGNHDFDYGVERMRELQKIANFPMRGANVLEAGGQPFLGTPIQVFEVGPVRVGVLALAYHNTAQTGSQSNFLGLRFGSGLDAARQWVPRLRDRADVVVVLSHQGSKVDRELVQAVPGIDVIIGAHSHDALFPPERVGAAWMIQALSDGAALGETTLTLGPDKRVMDFSGRMHTLWNEDCPADPAIAKLIDGLRAPQLRELEAPVAYAAERIGRRHKSESPFDVLVGDLLREHARADIALLPGVGYGVTLEPGLVTREMLTTLLPHPTKVATVTLTGRQVLEILEQSATTQRPDQAMDGVGGLVQTSGLAWTLDLTQPIGKRIRDVRVGDAAIQGDRSYRVVTNEGMLKGLHRYRTFAAGRDAEASAQGVTDVIEAAMRQRGTLRASTLGKVKLIKACGQ